MFVEGLVSLLANDAGVKPLLQPSPPRKDGTNGVFPNVAPDEVNLPYIVYTQVHRENILSYQGVNRLQFLRFQISCYAANYKASKTLAMKARLLLDGFVGTLSDGSLLEQTIPQSEHDAPEAVFKGTVYGTHLDYLFAVSPAES